MKKQVHRVFCYGTLKRGQYFHDAYLGEDKATFIGPAVTGQEFSLFIDGLPHMIAEESPNGVKGELYLVDEDVLAKLDELEAVPLIYYREIIEVYNEKKERILAWAYLRPRSFKGHLSSYKEETGEFT